MYGKKKCTQFIYCAKKITGSALIETPFTEKPPRRLRFYERDSCLRFSMFYFQIMKLLLYWIAQMIEFGLNHRIFLNVKTAIITTIMCSESPHKKIKNRTENELACSTIGMQLTKQSLELPIQWVSNSGSVSIWWIWCPPPRRCKTELNGTF